MTARLGVLGASGFVGSALCERLYFDGRRDFVAFCHSTGNGWRLTRLGGLRQELLDITDRERTLAALRQCDVIVNCALGSGAAMFQGLRNVLSAARKLRVRKVIHLSSIAIYGQDPGPDTVTEAAVPAPGDNLYARAKLAQDDLVLRYHRSGVPCYILCPGNIAGPYSFFARGLVERLAGGPLPLVDGGRYPTNLVHVDNLVEAILTAVRAESGAGERYFVNETVPVAWRRLYDDLATALGRHFAFEPVTRADVLPHVNPAPVHATLLSNFRGLASEEFRNALAVVPALASVERAISACYARLPRRIQADMRERLHGPARIAKVADSSPRLDDRYVTVQVRRFYHSPEKLASLGWRPPLSYDRGLETFVSWLRANRLCR